MNTHINAALSSKKRELKRVLLSRFTVKQSNEISSRYGVPLSGANTKDEKVEVLASSLPLNEVAFLARHYKAKYRDVLEELDRFRAKLEARRANIKAEKRVEELVRAL